MSTLVRGNRGPHRPSRGRIFANLTVGEPTKPSKLGFVGFVGAIPADTEKIAAARGLDNRLATGNFGIVLDRDQTRW